MTIKKCAKEFKLDAISLVLEQGYSQTEAVRSRQQKHRSGQGCCLRDHKQWPNAFFRAIHDAKGL